MTCSRAEGWEMDVIVEHSHQFLCVHTVSAAVCSCQIRNAWPGYLVPILVRLIRFCTFKSKEPRIAQSVWRQTMGLDHQGSIPCRGQDISLFTASRPALGPTQPPVQWVQGVKRPGREADHSHPSDAEVKNAWTRTSTTPCIFVA
jgi:hypothetical protein